MTQDIRHRVSAERSTNFEALKESLMALNPGQMEETQGTNGDTNSSCVAGGGQPAPTEQQTSRITELGEGEVKQNTASRGEGKDRSSEKTPRRRSRRTGSIGSLTSLNGTPRRSKRLRGTSEVTC